MHGARRRDVAMGEQLKAEGTPGRGLLLGVEQAIAFGAVLSLLTQLCHRPAFHVAVAKRALAPIKALV